MGVDGQAEDRGGGAAARDATCLARHEKEQRQKDDQRPQGANRESAVAGDMTVERRQHQRQWRVDEARPMRDKRLGRANARQGAVEPRRAVHQVADLDQSRCVIGIAEGGDEACRVDAQFQERKNADSDEAPHPQGEGPPSGRHGAAGGSHQQQKTRLASLSALSINRSLNLGGDSFEAR